MTSNKSDLLFLIDTLDIVEQAQLKILLAKCNDIFVVEYENLGYTDKVKPKIHLIDNEPVTQSYHRIPPNQYSDVREHMSKLLRKGVIQEIISAYALPIMLKGSIRLWIDYRRLNLKTKKDALLLMGIDESFNALQGVQYFSMTDLVSSYHQVMVEEHDNHKTAFSTRAVASYEVTKIWTLVIF